MLDYLATIYRDPLFGITIVVAIIVILVFADYGRNRYRAKKRQIALDNFTQSYNGGALNDELVEFLHLAKNPIPPLLLLAKTYARVGDSAMAIKIYLSLLDSTRNTQEKIIILESLGITYFEAGFLQRAKNIFLQILKTYPRNTQILSYLMRTYESMGEYQAAIDTLECLDELHAQEEQESQQIKQYLHFMILSQNPLLSLDKKHKEIISLMRYSGQINRLALDYLFTYAREMFWEELLRFTDITFCLDILWRCDKTEVPFETIKARQDIMQVFIAKGFYQILPSLPSQSTQGLPPKESSAKSSQESIFELEVLRILIEHSTQKGGLSFEYRCHHCKNLFPFDSYRCPICAKMGEMDLVYKIIKHHT